MTSKPIIPRSLVRRDAEEALDYYLSEGGARTAAGFVDELERVYRLISRNPALGSRYAQELNLPGLRYWPLNRYPQLVVYFERDDHVDVWRVLHGQRDIPAWMRVWAQVCSE